MGVMNLGEMMDRSIDILKKYVTTIIMFSIGYGVVMFLGLFILMLVGGIFAAFAVGIFENITFIIVMVIILCVIVVAVSLTINIGVIKIASQEFFEERIYASAAVGASFKSIIKVLGITIIALIFMLPAIAVFSAIIYFLYKGFQSSAVLMDGNLAGIILFVIIYIVLVLSVLAVIIGYVTLFCFSLHALTIEKKGVISSVKRSFTLVKHNFWRVYVCLILFGASIYAIQYSIMSFLGLVISILFMILKALNVEQSYGTFLAMAYTYSNLPFTLISWCIISPVATIMISLLYYNQRFKKEGYDMVLRLKEIQKNQEREQLNDSIEFNKSL